MKIINTLNNYGETQVRSGKNVLLRLWLVVMVVCCGLSLTTAKASYPILQLDIGQGHNPAEIQEGFTAFTINDSGIVIDGIKTEVESMTAGEAIQVRWRWGPTSVPYEQLYRDFIFTVNGGIRITFSGLEPNETYEITIWSVDPVGSSGRKYVDWLANGTYCLSTDWTGGSTTIEAEDSFAFSGNATADGTGMIVLEATPNPLSDSQTQYYAFVNAIMVSTLTPFNVARRPVPEDGTIIATNELELQWTPGYTSVSANVYVGEDFDDVNNATTSNTDIFRGNTVGVSFPIGSTGNPYPDGLTEATTYYWRIDEVEEDGMANKGSVWSFTVAPKTAFTPFPVDGSLFVDPNITLRWSPGAGSIEHRVFFGSNLQNVQAGTGGSDKGTVAEPSFTPGILERNKTYYWRVDESDGTNTYSGDIWSFTTSLPNMGTITMDFWENVEGDHQLFNLLDDPRYPDSPTRSEALSEFGTVDGVGDGYGAQIYGWLYCPVTGDYTFWLSCAGQGELWLSTDDDPDNIVLLASEANWGAYNSFTIKTDPVSLVAGEKYYIMTRWKDFGSWDHCQVAWIGPGIPEQEIIQGNYLSPFEPVSAYGPTPGNGSVDVVIDSALSWKSGNFKASSDVYFGTDFNDVNNVDASNLASYPNVIYANVDVSSYNPGLMDFNTTYFWKVNEVNNTQPDMLWKGKVWSFTTGNYLVIDDFEAYNDLNEDLEGSKRIYLTWSDGYSNPTVNGATIGYPAPDFANGEHFVETDIFHGGSQSGPLIYDNTTASYSEVSLGTNQMAIGSDWSRKGIDTLSIWFYGDPNNTGTEQLYIKLNDAKLSISSVNLTLTVWQYANISLADFGIDLTNVTQLAVGLERTGASGSEGILFMDDIRLYSSLYSTAPVPKIVYVDATDGQAGNTILATGEVLIAGDPGTTGSGADGLWRKRGFGNGTIFESGGDWGGNNTEDCPRLMTSVEVLEGNYHVYAYMWNDNAPWCMGASLEDSEGQLPVYRCADPNGIATLAVEEDFEVPVPIVVDDAGRTMWQVYLGTTDNTTTITVYIDDDANRPGVSGNGNDRTWYDGIGFKAVLPEE
ncbi:MAG: hypothetical protein JW715_03240 [Sedimentisphaerales bacterium]|nr:hypothetical protein [Sedimentisphaerales bacterium]